MKNNVWIHNETRFLMKCYFFVHFRKTLKMMALSQHEFVKHHLLIVHLNTSSLVTRKQLNKFVKGLLKNS